MRRSWARILIKIVAILKNNAKTIGKDVLKCLSILGLFISVALYYALHHDFGETSHPLVVIFAGLLARVALEEYSQIFKERFILCLYYLKKAFYELRFKDHIDQENQK